MRDESSLTAAVLVAMALLTGCELAVAGPTDPPCAMTGAGVFEHVEIGRLALFREPQTRAIAFASQMHINTDGAPDSYHPDDNGITHICNGVSLGVGAQCKWEPLCMPAFRQARAEGFRGPTKICFFAMVTDRAGVPIIQGPADPKPGFFVSTTALHQPGRDVSTPQGQVDSNTVPFAVIPGNWQSSGNPGPKLGDFGVALRRSNGAMAFFVIADTGPRRKLGEGSVALHQALGNDPFQMRFGKRRAFRGLPAADVFYVMFPGTAVVNETFDAAMVRRHGARILEQFGGENRLRACAR